MYQVLLTEESQICTILETEFFNNCRIHRAGSMEELLLKLETVLPDLAIIDLDLSGSRTEQTLAALESFASKGTVLFLAEQMLFDPSHPLNRIQAADYLLKPCTDRELILTLEHSFHLCEKKRSEQEAASDSVRLSYVRDQIERYIREHYQQELSMQAVAHAMNYSETHFCRLFKQCFKMNFSVYLNTLRVEQAKQLLLSTNQNVKEIAGCCGYQDNSYFIRVFKRFTGMTPLDYRMQARTCCEKSPMNPKIV